MWIAFAFLSALFAGITSVLAKCGIKKTDFNVATAIRTLVVLLFSWGMVFAVGSQSALTEITPKTAVFLVLSGIATGASWLYYFKALQVGDINKVIPVANSSTVLTFVLAAIFFGEFTWLGALGIVLIVVGTLLMIEKSDFAKSESGSGWLLYSIGSAVFASLTAILGKVGVSGVDSNLGSAIRTGAVLVMTCVMVFVTGKQGEIKKVPKGELGFICLSGFATGASWLCYYKALKDGLASVVAPIEKLSVLVTVAFSFLVFKERLTKKSALGLALIVAGTLVMIIKV